MISMGREHWYLCSHLATFFLKNKKRVTYYDVTANSDKPYFSITSCFHKFQSLLRNGSPHDGDIFTEQLQDASYLLVVDLSSAGGADDPLVAILRLNVGEHLQRDLLLVRLPPPPPGERKSCPQPSQLGQHSQGCYCGHLGSGQGEQGDSCG